MIYPWHTERLESLLRREDRLPHALLLRGPEGTGKLALAIELGRALLCERGGAGKPGCGACAACIWVEQGGHPDFRRLEPESRSGPDEAAADSERKGSLQISVDQVRGIADFIYTSSHRGGAKVVLIHPAEALNIHAANALLKNLEEPPPRSYFLLVAHRWHLLLPTILSRCEQIALPVPGADAARAWLARQKLPDADLALAQAGGAPLLAARLDQEYWRQRDILIKAITGPELEALGVAEQLRDSVPAVIVGLLQKWSFDLVWHKVTGRVRYNPDYSAAVAAASARLELPPMLRFQRHMVRQQRIALHPLNARLFLEQLLLEYAALLRGEPVSAVA